MLIEQIIKFELRELEPFGRICTSATGSFYNKKKIALENIRVDYYFLLKYSRRQCTLLSLTWAKSLTKFSTEL